MKILITADWHLDNMRRTYLVDGIPNRELDLDKQVTAMAAYCELHKIDMLILAGDLFERATVSSYYFSKAIEYIREFTHVGTHVVIMSGNHDESEAGPGFPLALARLRDPSLTVVREAYVGRIIDSPNILFLPHERCEVWREYNTYTRYVAEILSKCSRADYPKFVIGHFQPEGMVPGSESEEFQGSTRLLDTAIFKTKTPIFCGHVHAPQTKGNVHVPGSITKMFMSEEPEEKGFIIYDTVESTIDRIPLDCQPIVKFTLDCTRKVNLTALSTKDIAGAMVGVVITAARDIAPQISRRDVEAIVEKSGGHLIKYETIIADAALSKARDANTVSNTPRSIFKRVLTESVDSVKVRTRLAKLGLSLLQEVSR